MSSYRPLSAAANEAAEDDGAVSKALHPRTPWVIYLFVALAAMGNLLFGYESAVISTAHTDYLGECTANSTSCVPGGTTFQQGLLVAGVPLGAVIVCPFAGFFQNGLGRRRSLILCCLVYLAAVAVSVTAKSFPDGGLVQLVVGRVLTGLSIGVFSSTAPMYIAELAPPHLRGALVTTNQVCICTGVLIGYGVTAAVSPYWRWEFAAATPMAVLLFLSFVFVTPYSPRWLMTKGREDEARTVLMSIRDGDVAAVEAELTSVREAIELTASLDPFVKLREPHIIWGVVIGVVGAFLQQMVGVNAVNGFAAQIFEDAGSGASAAKLEQVMIGVSKLVFVIVALLLMDRAGRKPLLLVGCAGMAISCISLALVFQLSPLVDGKRQPQGSGGIFAVFSLVSYMAFFEISLGPILWLLLSELYPLQVKGIAMGIGSTTCWLMTLFVQLAFPSMVAGMGVAGSFFFFAAMCVFSFVWIWMYIFETKGRSLEEIEELLRGPAKATSGADGAPIKGLSVSARKGWNLN